MFTVTKLLTVTLSLSVSISYGLKPLPPKQRSTSAKTKGGDGIGSRDDIACSPDSRPRVLTDFSDWFTSPNFLTGYPVDSYCSWLIVSQLQAVQLNFDFLHTEEFYDFVTIYDGDSTSSPIITSFDGLWDPAPVGVRSTGQSLLIVFTSDEAESAPGFNVSYTSAAIDLSPDPCSSLTRPILSTESSGTFQTNGFPDRYWNYANCQWLFESQEPGGIVEVTFDQFSTEVGYDVVRLFDGSSASAPLITGFDGQYPGPLRPVRSTQPYLFMRFISDYTFVDRGFNGTFRSLPAP